MTVVHARLSLRSAAIAHVRGTGSRLVAAIT